MLFLPIPFTSTCPVLLAGTVLAGVAAKDLLCPQMSYKKSPSKTELTSRPVEKETKEKSRSLRQQAMRQLCTAPSVPWHRWHGPALLCTSVLAAISNQQHLQGTQEKKKGGISVKKPTEKTPLSISCPGPRHDSLHLLEISMESTWQIWWYPQGKQQNSLSLGIHFHFIKIKMAVRQQQNKSLTYNKAVITTHLCTGTSMFFWKMNLCRFSLVEISYLRWHNFKVIEFHSSVSGETVLEMFSLYLPLHNLFD